jgi:archaemetzincin
LENLISVKNLGLKRLLGIVLAIIVFSGGAKAQTSAPQPFFVELVPVGEVDSELLRWLANNLTRAFGIRVAVGALAPLPEELYNIRRKQYDADRLVSTLVSRLKGNVWRAMGVVNEDLYAEPMDFVFGSANPGLGVAIISLKRLDDTYYGLPENQMRFRSRAIKEAVRFLGLSMRMRPLDDPQCIMSPSRSIEDIDRKIPGFCPVSQKDLEKIVKHLGQVPNK